MTSPNCAGCSRSSPAWVRPGADIFLREAQRVWPDIAPVLDDKALSGAKRLALPTTPDRLLDLAGDTEPAVLAAALVRAALDKEVVEEVTGRAA